MNNRVLGTILLVLAGLVVAGMLIHNNHLWFVVDLTVIAGCSTVGILLFRH